MLKGPKQNKSSDYFTSLGKQSKEIVRKYPMCYRYYDDMMGMIYINLDTYNESEDLKEEVFMLLQEPCINDGKGVDYTYAMEIKPGYDAEKDEEVEAMLIIRLVEAFY